MPVLKATLDGWWIYPPPPKKKFLSCFMFRCGNDTPEVCERCFISFSCLLLQPVCLFQTEAQDYSSLFWVERPNGGAARGCRFSISSASMFLEIILKAMLLGQISGVLLLLSNPTESFTKYMAWWNFKRTCRGFVSSLYENGVWFEYDLPMFTGGI